MDNLDRLHEHIFESDNAACFIERERILQKVEKDGVPQGPDKYARILAEVLENVSVPVNANDIILGRVVEEKPDDDMEAPCSVLMSTGHMSFQYEKLLRIGLKGILREITENARKLGDEKSKIFADNANIVVHAVKGYAQRYAMAAAQCGKTQAGQALNRVPYEPADDLYEALQSIWLVHMIASCYVGERDYAFGRLDEALLPFIQKALDDGIIKEDIVKLLAGFFIKSNEICGRATYNYNCKPVPCQSSKQYVNVGGSHPSVASELILEAGLRNNMAQPTFVVLLDIDADEAFTRRTFEVMAELKDKMMIYNYPLIVQCLLKKGIPKALADDLAFSACCTLDLHYHTYRREFYSDTIPVFCNTLDQNHFESIDSLLDAYTVNLQNHIQEYVNHKTTIAPETCTKWFVFDCLLLGNCAERCRYPGDGGTEYMLLNIFLPGIATLGDSLYALDYFVFKNHRYSYKDYTDIVKKDFNGQQSLLRELKRMDKFGNDSVADHYAERIGNAMLDAVDRLELPENTFAVGGFYSLDKDNHGRDIPATPDGRLAGSRYSENQSPVYGADKQGVTALLNSLAQLPFNRAPTGGLNVTFGRPIPPDVLQALFETYFDMGGLHIGITVMDRAMLEDALVRPERYKTLTVRLYGFSEYYINLPLWQQQAILNRTAYK